MANGITVTAAPTNGVVVATPSPRPINVTVPVGKQGLPGPPGAQAQWDAMTQAEYNALSSKDPNTLYVIVP